MDQEQEIYMPWDSKSQKQVDQLTRIMNTDREAVGMGAVFIYMILNNISRFNSLLEEDIKSLLPPKTYPMKQNEDVMYRILEMRFGIVDGRKRTRREIGEHYGLSVERIRQIEHKAATMFAGNLVRLIKGIPTMKQSKAGK